MRQYIPTLALLLAVVVGACTADRLEPGEAAGIHIIRLVTPPEPRRYDVNVFAAPSAGTRIGAYDAVLANDIMRAPEAGDIDAQFTRALTEEAGLHLGAELGDALEKSLADAGYRIIRDPAAAADAILTATPLFAGYVDQPLRPYTPLLIVEVELTSAATGTTLFRQRYTYSRLPYLGDDVQIVPEGRYAFDNEAALLGDPAGVAVGLRAGIDRVAAKVKAGVKLR